jgi:hypothetical protein
MMRQGQAYSEDLRTRVLTAVERSRSIYKVASLFDVCVYYVCKIYKTLARRRLMGITMILPKCGRSGRKLAQVAAHPDAALAAPRIFFP